MSKVFVEANLSEKDIDRVINAIKRKRNEINDIKREILIRLAEFTRDTARTTLDSTTNKQYSTDHLKYSIQIEYNFEDLTAKVVTNEPYAQYVEFGTGVVGKAGSQDYKFSEMSIEPVSYANYSWKYYNPQLEAVINTNGQKPHRFMLQALHELRENYTTIANEVLKERGVI